MRFSEIKKQNKTILLIANSSWYFYNFRKELISKIKKKGYKLLVICPEDEYSIELEKISELIFWNLNRSSINIFKEIYSIIFLIKALQKIKPTLIHTFTMKASIYGTIAALVTNRKIVVNSLTGLGTLFLSKNIIIKIIRFFLLPLIKLLFIKKSSKLILQNHEDHNYLINLGITNIKKSIVIPSSGINLKYFKPGFKKKSKYFKILFPSRLIKQKGILELLDAFKTIWKEGYKFKLYIAGDVDNGNISTLSKDEVSELKRNKNIILLGHIKNMKRIYSKIDIVVLPSWREGLSKSLLEASAMEKPIITTDVPGCRDVITHKKTGLLVDVRDSKAIKDSILYLYRNASIANKLGKNARKNVLKNFEVNKVNEQTLKVYSELIHSKNKK